jgi:hypothetical protein
MKRAAAIRPTRPVTDSAGPIAAAPLPGALVPEGVEPPPVEVGLLSGLALPVMQVLTPRIIPLAWALLKISQMVWLVEVVWTLDPPRTSVREFITTLQIS